MALHQTKPGQTGHKDDAGKPCHSLIPVEATHAMAVGHTYGAKKYARDNWRGGMPHTRLYDAIDRHLKAWLSGKDIDDGPGGSGLPHLWLALTSLGMLVWMTIHRPDLDDRWKPHVADPKPKRRR